MLTNPVIMTIILECLALLIMKERDALFYVYWAAITTVTNIPANLYIAYKGQEAEGSRVETPLGGSTAEADYTPDQRLVTTLNLGKAPDYIGEETTPDSGNVTTPSETTPEEGTPDGTTPAETQPQGKKGCKSILALPALVTLLAAGYALSKRRD